MIGFYLHLTIEIAHTKFLVPAELKYNGYFSVLTFLDLFIAYYNIDNSLKFFPILDSSLNAAIFL